MTTQLNKIHIMGIINLTPDSFSKDGLLRAHDSDEAYLKSVLKRVDDFAKGGASWIDVGAESTRPNFSPIPWEVECLRLIPILKGIRQEFPNLLISVDTMKSQVAERALDEGIHMINDVSGLDFDINMIEILKKHEALVTLMHSKKSHLFEKTSPCDTFETKNILGRIINDLKATTQRALQSGIEKKRIVIDPGIGFGKTPQENLTLIANLNELLILNFPIMLGTSRKSFIDFVTKAPVHERLAATLASNIIGYQKGATYFRVHDVKETFQALEMARILCL